MLDSGEAHPQSTDGSWADDDQPDSLFRGAEADPRFSDIHLSRLASSKGQRMVHACDCCRKRKIKCDTRQPSCSNCENAGVVCQSLNASRKRGRKAAPSSPVRLRPEETTLRRGHQSPNAAINAESNGASPCPVVEPSRPGVRDEFSRMYNAGRQHHQSEISGSLSPLTYRAGEHDLDYAPEQNDVNSSHISDAVLADRDSFTDTVPNLSFTAPGFHPLLADLELDISTAGVRHGLLTYLAVCVDAFFNNIYPTYPVVYRPTLTRAIEQLGTHGGWDIKNFALITSLCAYTCAILPAPISTGTWPISEIFYRISKRALDSYRSEDVENPDSTSIVIRSFHSGWVHAAGKSNASWHIMGEAVRIAQIMRLHDEQSYARMPHLEGQLCRRVFWTLYTGDKSAAVLGGLPICLQSDFFRNRLKVSYPEDFPDQDTLTYKSANGKVHKISMMVGFNANQDLWRAAETLLAWDAEEVERIRIGAADTASSHLHVLASDFLKFRMCLEGLPTSLRFYNSFALSPLEFVFSSQNGHDFVPRALMIQRTNLHISYQCLKMVILRKFPMLYSNQSLDYLGGGLQLHYGSPEALSPVPAYITTPRDPYSTPAFAVEILQVAEDMMYVIQTSTPELIRVNGEACVEKIRLVGAAILELIANKPPSILLAKAEKYRELYPHILAMLESKASDAAEHASNEPSGNIDP